MASHLRIVAPDASGQSGPMTDDEDDDLDDIAQIEARIEELAEVAERCRKIVLGSKLAIAGGAAWLVVTVLGLFGTGQMAALGSIALILGGIVSLGSNLSTLEQTVAQLGEAETMRSRLIDAIDLSVVRDTPTKLM
jgi:hypothetical protein